MMIWSPVWPLFAPLKEIGFPGFGSWNSGWDNLGFRHHGQDLFTYGQWPAYNFQGHGITFIEGRPSYIPTEVPGYEQHIGLLALIGDFLSLKYELIGIFEEREVYRLDDRYYHFNEGSPYYLPGFDPEHWESYKKPSSWVYAWYIENTT